MTRSTTRRRAERPDRRLLRRTLRAGTVAGLALVAAIVVLQLLYPLPPRPERPVSQAIPASGDTALGARLLAASDAHSGLSGVVPLVNGYDAFAARVLLARAAEVSIDVQYYIWQTDTTGWILLDELRAAAERGVRVRLLLDDNGIPGLDRELAALDALPTAEVRLFNPFTLRRPKTASYLFDFVRLNRRMHNKSMTVDGVATVVGGRNVGDIYFTFGTTQYFDLDVIAVGPAASDVSAQFDRYWSSESAYPADMILPPAPDGLQALMAAAGRARASTRATPYVEVIRTSPVVTALLSEEPEFEWTTVTLLSDDPAKGLGEARAADTLVGKLPAILGRPRRSLDLVSAYFVPGARGTALLADYAREGVATRVLTNSLEATDVAVVHSGYAKYRPELIDAGVQLLELRSDADREPTSLLDQLTSGSSSSLHAKTFAVDGERIFIGSFNFDPRSAALNTEMGLLIDSPTLAGALSAALDRDGAYRVRRGPDGGLEWVESVESDSDQDIVYSVEPRSSALKRGIVWLLSWLPLEPLL